MSVDEQEDWTIIDLGLKIGKLNKRIAELESTQASPGEWTSKKPTVAGWYWWRLSGHDTKVLHVRDDDSGLYIQGFGSIRSCEGQWSGPLTPPEGDAHG